MSLVLLKQRLVAAIFLGFLLPAVALAADPSPCDTLDVTEERFQSACVDVTITSSNPLSNNCEAIIRGQCRYNRWCSSCHGLQADGVNRFGDFAANLQKHWRGYGGFIEIVLNGATGNIGRMPPWAGILDITQINQIGAFLETKADEKAYWK